MDTFSDPHAVRRCAGAGCRRSLAVLAALLLAPFALAQSAPSWVLGADGNGAYVEAFSYPGSMTQEDTAIFVICDPDAPSGLTVWLWIGSNVAPPEEAEGLVRLGQGEIQRYTWFVFGADGDRATPKLYADLERLLADLRTGGTMAIRLMLTPGAPDANQPTFQYDVSGFAEVERQLTCGAAAAPAAPDPFGAAPADPFAAAPTPAAPSTPSPPAAPGTPRSRAAAPPTASAPAAAEPLPPLPPPSQMAPPQAAVPSADWYLSPDMVDVSIEGAGSIFGFACFQDGTIAAYLVVSGVEVVSDAQERTFFTFVYDGPRAATDELVFFHLGDGLYAVDSTAAQLIAFAIEANDRVRVSYDGTLIVEAPGGEGFFALMLQMPCLAAGE